MHVIGTAGHVDHGKSTLVRALTGIDPDRFAEEKRRGLTIDLGFAWVTLPSGRQVGIVDVPGHERFIRNMLAGVGGIDASVFVVAADEGWMPQSEEHLQILDFLQVDRGLVAVTKIDAVDSEMVELVISDLRDRLRGSVLEGCPVVGVSALTGAGMDDLVAQIDVILEDTQAASDRGRPRLFVDRSFTITGAGTVVTGTLTGGTLAVGDEIEVLPSRRRARIRTLQTHSEPVERAVPGSRVAANLVGIDRDEIGRGDALVRPDDRRTTRTAAVRLWASRSLDHPVTERGAYELFVGSAEVSCRVRFLSDPGATDEGAPAVPAGGSVLAHVYVDRPLPVDVGDRFVIRDLGRWETVAGGTVLDPFPPTARRGDPGEIARLEAREGTPTADLVSQVVKERGIVGRDELTRLTGASEGAVADAIQDPSLVSTGSFVLDAAHAERLAASAQQRVADHHTEHRLERGLPRETLRADLGLDARAFGELLERWTEEGRLVAEGALLRLPSHGIALSAEERRAADRLLETLRAAGASPPDPQTLGVPAALLAALEETGEIVRLDSFVYPADVVTEIEQRVAHLIADQGQATVAQVRDTVGTTRKYAVPLLEHLDTSGVTQRRGDVRVLGPRGRELVSGDQVS